MVLLVPVIPRGAARCCPCGVSELLELVLVAVAPRTDLPVGEPAADTDLEREPAYAHARTHITFKAICATDIINHALFIAKRCMQCKVYHHHHVTLRYGYAPPARPGDAAALVDVDREPEAAPAAASIIRRSSAAWPAAAAEAALMCSPPPSGPLPTDSRRPEPLAEPRPRLLLLLELDLDAACVLGCSGSPVVMLRRLDSRESDAFDSVIAPAPVAAAAELRAAPRSRPMRFAEELLLLLPLPMPSLTRVPAAPASADRRRWPW